MPEDLGTLSGETLFQTQRLRCRRWLPEDLEALFAVYSDPEGAKWVDDGEPITRSECEQWLGVTAENYRQRGYGMFALEDPGSEQILGFCGLVHPGGQVDAEIKYSLQRSVWGQGLASEIVPAMLNHGAERHGLTKIIATVAPENVASQRVLLKAGMKLIAIREDKDGEYCFYEWYSDS